MLVWEGWEKLKIFIVKYYLLLKDVLFLWISSLNKQRIMYLFSLVINLFVLVYTESL